MKSSRGFTLVELVVVMIVISILAAYVSAKLNFTEYDASGYAEQFRAMVRYVQKVAVAQRRSIVVTMVNGTGGSAGFSAPVIDPGASGSIAYTAPKGVTVSSTQASITFDALGRATAAATVTITGGSVSRIFYIEQETGYVHE